MLMILILYVQSQETCLRQLEIVVTSTDNLRQFAGK
jgi:hypothetical protein